MSNKLKRAIKRILSSGLRTCGRAGILRSVEPWLEQTIVPKLLDRSVIAQEPTLVKLRSSNTHVLCDPYVYTHWATYWFGRLHESGLQVFLERTLRPGDTYIDIGTNFGHFAFLAGNLVGAGGRVEAFEPNPELASLVESQAKSAVQSRFQLHAFALGAEEGEFELHIPVNHSGGATLRTNDRDNSSSRTVVVPVHRGDTVLAAPVRGSATIVKIDVEGFEPAVVAGMMNFIRAHAQAVVMEVTPAWIGGSKGVCSLFEQMSAAGCQAWLVSLGKSKHLAARQCQCDEIVAQENVYFVKHEFVSQCAWNV